MVERLSVRTWEGRRDRTIVCLHALGGSRAHWSGIGPRLATIGTVHAVDLVGFGRTPLGADGASLDVNRRLLADLLAETGPAVLVGSSFGGGVALMQAAAQPVTVRALILSGSMLPAPTDHRNHAMADLTRRRLRQRGRDIRAAVGAVRDGRLRPNHASIHEYMLRGNAADPAAMDQAVVAASVEAARRPRVQAMRAGFSAATSSFGLMTDPGRFDALLDTVEGPVLVIHGGLDRTVPVGNARAVARARPDWDLVVLDGLGHMPHLEAPDAWLGLVTGWLTSAGAPAPRPAGPGRPR